MNCPKCGKFMKIIYKSPDQVLFQCGVWNRCSGCGHTSFKEDFKEGV